MERHKKMVMGPIDKVPCPWCGQPNDFSELAEQGLLRTDAGDAAEQALRESGFSRRQSTVVDCDHCKRKSEIVQIDQRPRIIVRQFHK